MKPGASVVKRKRLKILRMKLKMKKKGKENWRNKPLQVCRRDSKKPFWENFWAYKWQEPTQSEEPHAQALLGASQGGEGGGCGVWGKGGEACKISFCKTNPRKCHHPGKIDTTIS